MNTYFLTIGNQRFNVTSIRTEEAYVCLLPAKDFYTSVSICLNCALVYFFPDNKKINGVMQPPFAQERRTFAWSKQLTVDTLVSICFSCAGVYFFRANWDSYQHGVCTDKTITLVSFVQTPCLIWISICTKEVNTCAIQANRD